MNPSRSIVTTKEISLAEGLKVLANELAWVAGLVEGVAGRVKLDSTKPRPVQPHLSPRRERACLGGREGPRNIHSKI